MIALKNTLKCEKTYNMYVYCKLHTVQLKNVFSHLKDTQTHTHVHQNNFVSDRSWLFIIGND